MFKMNIKKYKKLRAKQRNTASVSTATTTNVRNLPKEVQVIAKEVKIVRALAGNDVNKRNQQLRKLRKWMELRAGSSFPFKEDDFMRIWKGLYYNMWMSDKPLVQEDLSEQLAQLLLCFNDDVSASVSFFNAFLRTMCNEWFGIDQWRIDKFQMLVRRMLRYMFRVLKAQQWQSEAVQLLNLHLQETVLLSKQTQAIGLTMHLMDIYFEELAKVAAGDISAEQVDLFVQPFVGYVAFQRDAALLEHCRQKVFEHLLYQSALGRAYQDKYEAWKEMGFPTKNIDDLEVAEEEQQQEQDAAEEVEEEEPAAATAMQQQALDPRAGNVDVLMPELPLHADMIIAELQMLLRTHEFNVRRQKLLNKLLKQFQTYDRGEFPLGVKSLPGYKQRLPKQPLIQHKIENLENLENEVYGLNRKLKQLNKRKRRKLLKSINFEQVDENNMEEAIAKMLPQKQTDKKRKKVMSTGWIVEEIQTDEQPTPAKQAKLMQPKLSTANENEQQKPMVKKKQQQMQQKLQTTKKQIKVVAAAESTKPTKANDCNTAPLEHEKKPARAAVAAEPTLATTANEWTAPLAVGEIEYFLPSRKLQIKNANAKLVPNPLNKMLSKKTKTALDSTPKSSKAAAAAAAAVQQLSSAQKRVRIVTKLNKTQKPSDYIQQIKSSPDIPYNANQRPGKGLLKPNLLPSPINPFYKKKIGLRLPGDNV